jgi:putative transposase
VLTPTSIAAARAAGQAAGTASADYRQLLEQFGMKASMSRRGNCYDNAPMESFWASLEKEQVHHWQYATRAEAEADIFDYIECFYNNVRRHSAG